MLRPQPVLKFSANSNVFYELLNVVYGFIKWRLLWTLQFVLPRVPLPLFHSSHGSLLFRLCAMARLRVWPLLTSIAEQLNLFERAGKVKFILRLLSHRLIKLVNRMCNITDVLFKCRYPLPLLNCWQESFSLKAISYFLLICMAESPHYIDKPSLPRSKLSGTANTFHFITGANAIDLRCGGKLLLPVPSGIR